MTRRTGVTSWAAACLALLGASASLSAREGSAAVRGDSFEDPISVGALPFLTTGSTCGLTDDVSSVPCTYSPQGAPDVIYRYIPDHDMTVTISTCGSSFPGSFVLFDGSRTSMLCAPSYCLNGGFASVNLLADSTYYVAVDSEYGSCGEYILSIDECAGTCQPVIVRCPAAATQENENSCVPGYVDELNGGCVAGGCHVSPVPCIGSDVTICGTIVGSSVIDDVDTYEFRLSVASQVTITLSGGRAILAAALFRPADGGVPVVPVAFRRIDHGVAFSQVLESGRYWLQLRSDSHQSIPCDNPYLIQFSGLTCAPTPTQRSSWGTLKRKYH